MITRNFYFYDCHFYELLTIHKHFQELIRIKIRDDNIPRHIGQSMLIFLGSLASRPGRANRASRARKASRAYWDQ